MTVHEREILGLCDRSDFAVLALSTLQELLRHAIASGEDMSFYQDGLPKLFEPHISAIEAANMVVRSYVYEAAKAAEASEADSERIHLLRNRLIGDAVKDGAEPGEIAAALNMRRTTIDRVIRKMSGQAADPEAARMAG